MVAAYRYGMSTSCLLCAPNPILSSTGARLAVCPALGWMVKKSGESGKRRKRKANNKQQRPHHVCSGFFLGLESVFLNFFRSFLNGNDPHCSTHY
jgi:hypothetical protein